jgi:hypothetical protein
MKITFLVTPKFDKSYKILKKKYPSVKTDVEQFKKDFSKNPKLGDDLGGGYRKVRIAIQSKNRGKSGGARIITYELCIKEIDGIVVLVNIYDKSEFSTMPDWEYKMILQNFLQSDFK